MRSTALLVPLLVAMASPACGNADRDPCQRAIARLARFDAAQGWKPPAARMTEDLIEQCRRGRSKHDPALRCAIDSASDDAAFACIRAGLDHVLRNLPDAADGGPPGKGLNPLLAP